MKLRIREFDVGWRSDPSKKKINRGPDLLKMFFQG